MGNTVRTQPNIGSQTHSDGELEAYIQPSETPVTLLSLIGTNTGADQYIQVWDANAEDDASAELVFTFPVPAGKTFSLDTPIKFERGVYITNASQAVSSEPTEHQGSADCWFVTRHI